MGDQERSERSGAEGQRERNPDNLFDRDDPRQSPELAEDVAFKLFVAGWFFLPWLWLMNVVYFRELLVGGRLPPKAKTYVLSSGFFFVVSAVAIVVWAIVYNV
eukprot:CAMPEP_0119137826 /NCGR_PEP_ID=MMETSP1310-20130426/24456_1 /TAXON_ID=464262 /ORGANISM="Genus nov. species nov., Strain RCC2339" /LENGTH=102 /DNA_ID=CAMNT_0007128953 /DNA_START=173 /DNA_END=477 /DNA_ORIENTATION=-